MPTDTDLSKALVNACEGLKGVKSDIANRLDYNKHPQLKTTFDTLTKFSQGLLVAEAQPTLSEGDKAAFKAEEEGGFRVKSRELNKLRSAKRIFQAYPTATFPP